MTLQRTLSAAVLFVVFCHSVATNFVCPKLDSARQSSSLYALPHSQTGYVTCVGRIKIEAHCPDAAVWSDAVKTCVRQQSTDDECVGCLHERSRRDTAIETETTCATVCPQVFDPRKLVLMPHATCTRYNLCVLGLMLTVACPNDLRFNKEKCQCDFKENVYCPGEDPATTTIDYASTTTAVEVTTQESTTEEPVTESTTEESTSAATEESTAEDPVTESTTEESSSAATEESTSEEPVTESTTEESTSAATEQSTTEEPASESTTEESTSAATEESTTEEPVSESTSEEPTSVSLSTSDETTTVASTTESITLSTIELTPEQTTIISSTIAPETTSISSSSTESTPVTGAEIVSGISKALEKISSIFEALARIFASSIKTN